MMMISSVERNETPSTSLHFKGRTSFAIKWVVKSCYEWMKMVALRLLCTETLLLCRCIYRTNGENNELHTNYNIIAYNMYMHVYI